MFVKKNKKQTKKNPRKSLALPFQAPEKQKSTLFEGVNRSNTCHRHEPYPGSHRHSVNEAYSYGTIGGGSRPSRHVDPTYHCRTGEELH